MASLTDDPAVRRLIELAREEDFGTGDATTSLLAGSDATASFKLLMKQPGVFAGEQIIRPVLDAYDPAIELTFAVAGRDGSVLNATPVTLATLRGPLESVLAVERVLLNFLQRLSGVATRTRQFVDAVIGTGAVILDTRKTIPGWRTLDRYAVRCGGGTNHRAGLHDAVLIKDNHLAGVPVEQLAGTVFEMLNRLAAGGTRPGFVEVEVTSIEQLEVLLSVMGIDILMLDNFAVPDLKDAVMLRNEMGLRGKVALEASGGIQLDNVRAVADTGVERISVGAITHSAPAVDLSLERV